MSTLQINHHQLFYLLFSSFCCFGFVLGCLYLLHPWATEFANALDDTTSATLSISSDGDEAIPIPSSSGPVRLEVAPVVTGSYVSASDTVTVTNTSSAGYSLYISSSSADSSLYLDGNNNNSSINTTNGTASSPAVLKLDTYGYAVSKDADGAVYTGFDSSYTHPNQNSKWAAVPVYGSGDMIQSISGIGSGKIDVYYGAYVDNAVPAGEYTGSITYTALSGSYTPNPEATNDAAVYPTSGVVGDAVELNIVTNLHTLADIGAVIITLTSTSTGTNYTCTNPTPDTSTGTLTISCTTPTDLTAGTYTIAVNVPTYSKTYTITNGYEVISTLRSGLYMQDITKDMCRNTKTYEQTGATYDLIDRRDNSTYRVRKLKDGNCWMVQNLRLEGSRKLTTSDSNVLNNNFTLPASTENWCSANSATCYNTDQVLYTGNPEYGTYYSWHAATAGTGTASMTSGNAPSSICPKSWHLPTGGTNGEFYTLYAAYQSDYGWTNLNGGNNDMAKTTYQNIGPALTYSGHRYDVTYRQGVDGLWWSSAAYTGDRAYAAGIGSDDTHVYGGTYNYLKWVGFSVRCLLSS